MQHPRVAFGAYDELSNGRAYYYGSMQPSQASQSAVVTNTNNVMVVVDDDVYLFLSFLIRSHHIEGEGPFLFLLFRVSATTEGSRNYFVAGVKDLLNEWHVCEEGFRNDAVSELEKVTGNEMFVVVRKFPESLQVRCSPKISINQIQSNLT